MEHKFNIGNRVRQKSCTKEGVVKDVIIALSDNRVCYTILFDGDLLNTTLKEEAVELAPPTATYNFEYEYLDNVVVARFYEYKGEEKTELAKGHGHILHDGILGIAQAASYASKRCYDKLAGNDESKSYYINK